MAAGCDIAPPLSLSLSLPLLTLRLTFSIRGNPIESATRARALSRFRPTHGGALRRRASQLRLVMKTNRYICTGFASHWVSCLFAVAHNTCLIPRSPETEEEKANERRFQCPDVYLSISAPPTRMSIRSRAHHSGALSFALYPAGNNQFPFRWNLF